MIFVTRIFWIRIFRPWRNGTSCSSGCFGAHWVCFYCGGGVGVVGSFGVFLGGVVMTIPRHGHELGI